MGDFFFKELCSHMKYRTTASEITPTMTITSKLFEMMALMTVGSEAIKLG